MLEICEYVHKKNGRTRLNTNGHANAINGKDITPLLKGALDGVNISLNAPTAEEYAKLCRPQIENAFGELLSFAHSCKRNGVPCWFSVVDCIGQESVRRCREIADAVGIPLRVREMIGQ